MKVRVTVEVAHQGKGVRKVRTLEVPAKTLKLHEMVAGDGGLVTHVANDVLANVISSISGPAAQKLDPIRSASSPKEMEKSVGDALGFDLLEHIDRMDARQPQPPGPARK